MLLLLFIN